MTKLRGLGQPIPEAKIEALRQVLDRDHHVRFKSGALVEYEDCAACDGTGRRRPVEVNDAVVADGKVCPTCGGEKVRLLVTRPAGGTARYRLDTELRSAYAMALYGPPPKDQPTGKGERFGEDPPW